MQEIIQSHEDIRKQLQVKMVAYYTKAYRRVGLDPQQSLTWRMNEEDFDAARVKKLEGWLNTRFQTGQKHLIVGTGTGGLAVVLHRKGCDVFGIEPNDEANEIVYLKSQIEGMNKKQFLNAVAEALPYPDHTFDYIHCYTVLEHVRDVRKSLEEMVRVVKPGGFIHIHTPDYRFPYEPHYKILMPPFLPKWMAYLYFILARSPLPFFHHINFFNAKTINRILYRLPVEWLRVHEPFPFQNGQTMSKRDRLFHLFRRTFDICKNQEILIRKKDDK